MSEIYSVATSDNKDKGWEMELSYFVLFGT